MKRFMVGLIICIPITSVIVCVVLFVLAAKGSADLLPTPDNAMSKTSWQNQQR